MYNSKESILSDLPELELTEFGDFKIKAEYVENYDIIDFHCHLFNSVESMVPKIFRQYDLDFDSSFFDLSCYPIATKYFDFNTELYTGYPEKLVSVDGLKLVYEISGFGGFIDALKKSTPERMIRDMKLNNISKAVVLQINSKESNCHSKMMDIVDSHDELITFGSVHPYDDDIISRIDEGLRSNIKGWKLAPHVSGVDIDSNESIKLLKELNDTGLPIISCSGLAFPIDKVDKVPKGLRKTIITQNICKFNNVLEKIPNIKFVFAHGGLYQSDELIEIMKKHPHTFVEISTQPSHNIKKIIEEIGADRIMYGTDYPAFNHCMSLLSLLRATDDDGIRRNILYNNAAGILKL